MALCLAVVALFSVNSAVAENPVQALQKKWEEKKQSLQHRVLKNTAIGQKKAFEQKKREMQTKEYLHKQKTGDQTFIHGLVVHQGDVHERGDNVDAVGAELKLQEAGTVHADVTLINTGNVTAEGQSGARAAGTRVTVEGGRTGNMNVKSLVGGNVSATARGRGTVEAEAFGTQVESTGGAGSRINVNNRSNAAIRAIAQSR
jgi:hypothetical protein